MNLEVWGPKILHCPVFCISVVLYSGCVTVMLRFSNMSQVFWIYFLETFMVNPNAGGNQTPETSVIELSWFQQV